MLGPGDEIVWGFKRAANFTSSGNWMNLLDSLNFTLVGMSPSVSVGDITVAAPTSGVSTAAFTVILSNTVSNPVTVELCHCGWYRHSGHRLCAGQRHAHIRTRPIVPDSQCPDLWQRHAIRQDLHSESQQRQRSGAFGVNRGLHHWIGHRANRIGTIRRGSRHRGNRPLMDSAGGAAGRLPPPTFGKWRHFPNPGVDCREHC